MNETFNERLSTFTGNWPWAWKSKTTSSKTMHSKDARCVYVCVRATFYAPGWCVQVWRERTGNLFGFALFIIVFSSLDSWQRQSEMSRKGRVINHGMEVGFWARLVHSIVSCLFCWMSEREHERTLDDQSTRSHASTDHRALRWKTTQRIRNISLSQISMALFTPGIKILSDPITSGQVR